MNASATSACSSTHYVDRYNHEFRKRVRGLQPAALALLEQYRWPGNVRELRNAIERAMLLADSGLARRRGLRHAVDARRRRRPSVFRRKASTSRRSSGNWSCRRFERAGGNQTQAGQLLGINRDQVRYRIEKFGLAETESGKW